MTSRSSDDTIPPLAELRSLQRRKRQIRRPCLMGRFVISLCGVFATATLLCAQDNATIQATLHPAALPSPALKYRLLPDLRSQTSGNAVPLYDDATVKLKPLRNDPDEKEKWKEHFSKWTETGIKDFPRDEVRKALEPYKE